MCLAKWGEEEETKKAMNETGLAFELLLVTVTWVIPNYTSRGAEKDICLLHGKRWLLITHADLEKTWREKRNTEESTG